MVHCSSNPHLHPPPPPPPSGFLFFPFKMRAPAYHVSIVGEVFPERIPGSAALRDEVSHPVPEEVGFTRVRHVVPVRQLLFEHGVVQAAGQP